MSSHNDNYVRGNRQRYSAFAVLLFAVTSHLVLGATQIVAQDTRRTIVADDFVNNRPKARRQSKRTSEKAGSRTHQSRIYNLASPPIAGASGSDFRTSYQIGVTIWKLRPLDVYDRVAHPKGRELRWVSERVEADAEFQMNDYIRLSIESPRDGYLYVIDRDLLKDRTPPETNLIFPLAGDDNRVYAGRLIDIPPGNIEPLRALPKPNQAGEMLLIIVATRPLRFPESRLPSPITDRQILQWEAIWGSPFERFELDRGAGQARTNEEDLAAGHTNTRQLTRTDPAPQTIYRISPKSPDAVLFHVKLSYAQPSP